VLGLSIRIPAHRENGSGVDHHADHFDRVYPYHQLVRRVTVQNGVRDQLADHQHGVVSQIPPQTDQHKRTPDEVSGITDRPRVIAKPPDHALPKSA